MVELSGPEGQQYYVAIGQITSLRSPIPSDLKQFARGVHCVITTTSGKFLAVRETCADVHRRIMFAPR